MCVAAIQDSSTPAFQVTLRPNGDITFVYIEVQPVLTTAALYDHEPVAGISGWPRPILQDSDSQSWALSVFLKIFSNQK